MIVYVAGPMRGIPLFNFPMFDAACAVLRRDGLTVFAPQENDRDLSFDHSTGNEPPEALLAQMFRWDIDRILMADAIALLPGWRESAGAKLEALVAQNCGKLIYEVDFSVEGHLRKLEPLALGAFFLTAVTG